MIGFPNAKINIGLSITSKREDGYHNLASVFFPVNWCDILEILPAKELIFKSSGITIPGDSKSNLCLKAYHILNQDFDLPPVEINLKKNIPIGAGLGGGSADGAYTLKLLNDLFVLKLSEEELEDRAKLLGSDCAFFIKNRPVFAEEKGDVFTELDLNLKGYYLLVVNPEIHIGTSEAYSGVTPQLSNLNYLELGKKDVKDWSESVKNDFEDSVFPHHKKIEQLKNDMYELGAEFASMTGSGSTVFGIFEQKPKTDKFEKYSLFIEEIKQ